jgi:hypothetical protein
MEFYCRARAVKAIDVHSDDFSDRLYEHDDFAQVNRLPKLPLRERKCVAQLIVRGRQDLLRFVVRVDPANPPARETEWEHLEVYYRPKRARVASKIARTSAPFMDIGMSCRTIFYVSENSKRSTPIVQLPHRQCVHFATCADVIFTCANGGTAAQQ